MNKKLKHILSYLHPVVMESSESRYNPTLEVVLDGGKYLLNSRNTNYSYGPLHTLFKKAFRRLSPDWSNIDTVLILGFGVGCVAETILEYNPDCIIEGVEVDNKVIELGEKYFSITKHRNVKLHCEGAASFIDKCQRDYDLIIIDVYLDIDVPGEVETEKFLSQVRDSLKPDGLVVFNKYIYSSTTADQVEGLKKLYEQIFGNLLVLKILTTGRVFVAKKMVIS